MLQSWLLSVLEVLSKRQKGVQWIRLLQVLPVLLLNHQKQYAFTAPLDHSSQQFIIAKLLYDHESRMYIAVVEPNLIKL